MEPDDACEGSAQMPISFKFCSLLLSYRISRDKLEWTVWILHPTLLTKANSSHERLQAIFKWGYENSLMEEKCNNFRCWDVWKISWVVLKNYQASICSFSGTLWMSRHQWYVLEGIQTQTDVAKVGGSSRELLGRPRAVVILICLNFFVESYRLFSPCQGYEVCVFASHRG